MSTVMGFAHLDGNGFAYEDDRYESGETFIRNDGTWLSAVTLLEAYLARTPTIAGTRTPPDVVSP
jgi:hypothetical protein